MGPLDKYGWRQVNRDSLPSGSPVHCSRDIWKEIKSIWAATWQNQQNGMCAQRRLKSAWASAQSDQSLRCPHEENLGLSYPFSAQRRLIRLGGCPGWSESLLGAHATLLVLSQGGSCNRSDLKATAEPRKPGLVVVCYYVNRKVYI